MHQGRSLAQASPGSDLDGSYVGAMLLGFVAMSAVYGFLLLVRTRVERLEDERGVDDLTVAIEARRREGATVG